ncbi:MAG TPA: dihydrofolate reductase [Candidatus Copromorpha excrementigallinarum]|uniref:Dihydrofolate reductase n=1 Tax=Candidatus Allocopromorpha excrementigallinarum TaxID=2840742 RepID=A0A9D1I275_9FIRM|nr:dihydrofolate reductase [Candidatus Copromorpha excrementigallinarum]
MNAIAAVDENWAIGKDGRLLTHLRGDLKYYRSRTIGKVTVVGRKTLESFPGGKPLPDRVNIVMTRDPQYRREDCIVCRSVEEVLERVKEYRDEDVFIAGGAEVYRQFMEYCSVFYVTKIYDSFEGDRFFPDLDSMGLKVTWESSIREENGTAYRFLKYERV